MTAPYGLNEVDEMDENDEQDESAFSEAARRNGGAQRTPVRTAPRQTAYRPRPNNDFVTQAQLQAALARVSSQVATNSAAIKTVDSRVRGVAAEQTRITAALRKEVAERKTQEDLIRKDIQATKELAVLLPLIAPENPLIGLLALGGTSLLGGTSTSPTDTSSSTGNLLLLALAFGGLTKKP
ncbi:MAG TPA: hypothetical protein VGD56_14215 [Gemmatirosa sp.]